MRDVYVGILTAAAVTYVIRALPLTLIRKPLRNRFLRSFLTYVPFVTLAVMTFPAILTSTGSIWSALAGLLTAVTLAWLDQGLLKVSVGACAAVFLTELFLCRTL